MATYYTYIISFEIASDSTYSQRYNSLMVEIKKTLHWTSTTSFASVRSTESLNDISHRMYYNSDLIDSKDKLLVIDSQTNSATYRGPSKLNISDFFHIK